MPAAIVTRGVILRALGENMRKFNKFWPARSRVFRSLLVVAGVFLLTAALAPKANATVLIYFNFEDATLGGHLILHLMLSAPRILILAAGWCLRTSRPIWLLPPPWPGFCKIEPLVISTPPFQA